jgi:hypothetical protein
MVVVARFNVEDAVFIKANHHIFESVQIVCLRGLDDTVKECEAFAHVVIWLN